MGHGLHIGLGAGSPRSNHQKTIQQSHGFINLAPLFTNYVMLLRFGRTETSRNVGIAELLTPAPAGTNTTMVVDLSTCVDDRIRSYRGAGLYDGAGHHLGAFLKSHIGRNNGRRMAGLNKSVTTRFKPLEHATPVIRVGPRYHWPKGSASAPRPKPPHRRPEQGCP